ncbi:MAG: ribonuclease HI, partial [Clostridia bacterium]|nr:ribonuclease HI [Clostridia bacterium]
TNNRMELFAVLQGLRQLKESCDVTLYSDSAYFINAINNGWLKDWEKNNWKTSDKKPVKNLDLWQALLQEMKKHQITYVKVKGHADNEYNNRCDKLATDEIKKKANQTLIG